MKKLFFALPILLASCQSERVAFQFQPVAPTASPARPGSAAPPTTSAPAAGSTPVAAPTAGAAPRPLAPTGRRASQGQRAVPVAAAATPPSLATAAPSAAPKPGLVQRLVLKRLLRQPTTHGQARVAESGLGGIALFFIAIVLGLLAGLGALVSLIPGISFFGGVGLAAAGLLVIFLLYSLLSGGKKKKTPAK